MSNFRDYVTSTAFALTISRRQIESISQIHQFGDTWMLLTTSDFEQHDIEAFMPERIRARGTMQTPFVRDFAAYATQHADAGTTVFVDAQEMAATAVLNLGGPDAPGHADNKAKLTPIKTAAYKALLGITGRPITQQDAAEFFEDWVGQLAYFGGGETNAEVSGEQKRSFCESA